MIEYNLSEEVGFCDLQDGVTNPVLWAVTNYDTGEYDGSGEAICFDGTHLYFFNLGHCSCYGPLEDGPSGKWTPEEFVKREALEIEESMPVFEKVMELLAAA